MITAGSRLRSVQLRSRQHRSAVAWVLTGTSSRASTASITTTTALQRARHRRSQVCGRHDFRGHHPQGRQVLRWHRGHADDVGASTPLAPLPLPMLRSSSPFESIEDKDASTVTVKTKVPNFSCSRIVWPSSALPRPPRPRRIAPSAARLRPLDVRLYLRYRDYPGSHPSTTVSMLPRIRRSSTAS